MNDAQSHIQVFQTLSKWQTSLKSTLFNRLTLGWMGDETDYYHGPTGPKDEVQKWLDRDEPTSEQLGEQITLIPIWDRLGSINSAPSPHLFVSYLSLSMNSQITWLVPWLLSSYAVRVLRHLYML